jgi:hypothetical protein
MVAGLILVLTLPKLSKLSTYLSSTVSAVQHLVDPFCDCALLLVGIFTQFLTLLCPVCTSLSLSASLLCWHYLCSLPTLLWPFCILCCLLYIFESNHSLPSQEPQEQEVSDPRVKTEVCQALPQRLDLLKETQRLQILNLKTHKAALQSCLTVQCNRLADLRRELQAPEPVWIKKEPEC